MDTLWLLDGDTPMTLVEPPASELVAAPAQSEPTPRIRALKERMLDEPRYLSIEQALIITDVYQAHEGDSAARKRALSLRGEAGRPRGSVGGVGPPVRRR